ncbi:DUF726-domain-containing protein [Aaosphaeria arxii CBS 175.79]|uniref:DUF726-domain-containing protein n=1 Tax=Aaosphaeria arxii CBS 175.79 TaxID=1450172 RepID=A0A6A5XVE2_9PLEO|nr:DUF726-domain-containing protein [Aaosphaeria arxii CBS 175.79]KAF2017182.1 DUF726-domain-containing protein [Aaosphaeria arxii CBS 175.79]
MSDKPSAPAWQRAQSSDSEEASSPVTSSEQHPTSEKEENENPATDTVDAVDAEGTSEAESALPASSEPSEERHEAAGESQSLLDQASRFLEDPTIREAPREKKIEFLQSKGFSQEHIQKLLETQENNDALSKLTTDGERAWPSALPKPAASTSRPPPQTRDIPPIVTYPEFLTPSTKPPPLITTQRLVTTAYAAGGIAATMYGLAKFIIAPMTHNLAESRQEFASHTNDKLNELNTRLREVVSEDPALKPKPNVTDIVDDISEADSDPTELFHRDFGTQTSPSLSRRASVSSSDVEKSVVDGHEKRMKIITSHLQELSATRSNDAAASDSLKTKLTELTSYLQDMSYQSQYYSNIGGLYGSTYGMPKTKDGKDDQIEVLKGDIRAVKGVFLSARNFNPPRATGKLVLKKYRNCISCIFLGIQHSLFNMSFASHLPFGKSKSTEHKDEASLTTLLDADQCAELTFLIATITATMRKSLLDTFTAEEYQTSPKSSNISEEEALKAATSHPGDVDVEKEDKLKKERMDREEDAKKELAKPEVQDLKKEMLKYFDEWRGRVILRVGEIVNSREEANRQSKSVNDVEVEQGVKRQDTGLKSIATIDDEGEDEDAVFKELYPPISSTLAQMDESKRALVLHSLVLILLSLEHYSGHSRLLLLHLCSSLQLKLSTLKKDEETIARGLLEAANQQLNADAETQKANAEASSSRKWKVGLASVGGAALIGITGGLAAPFLAAGIGTVMGGLGLGATAAAGYLGTLASSSVLVGGLFGAYGARMTGKAMDDYAREVEDFGFIPIHHSHRPRKLEKEFRRLRIAIAISGWLTAKEEVVVPWRYLNPTVEGFALRWELETMLKLGNSMDSFVKSAAWSIAKGQIIKRTVFGALSAGLWPLGLLKVSSVLDNPFSVAKYRADRAGEVLADALINKVQGERPVTLIGYSLGSRLIYTCLQTLAKRKAFGLIESVVFLGTPAPSDAADWRKIRSVVSGRVVNVFSTNDYILAFLYRTSSIQLGIAGLQPVLGVHGVQNVDVSELVNGHLRYRYLTGSILKKIGFEDIDIKEVEREEEEMRVVEEMERKEREKKEKGAKSEDEEARDLENEVKKRNEQSTMDWAMEKMKLGSIWGGRGNGEKTEAEQMAQKEKEIQQREKVGSTKN